MNVKDYNDLYYKSIKQEPFWMEFEEGVTQIYIPNDKRNYIQEPPNVFLPPTTSYFNQDYSEAFSYLHRNQMGELGNNMLSPYDNRQFDLRITEAYTLSENASKNILEVGIPQKNEVVNNRAEATQLNPSEIVVAEKNIEMDKITSTAPSEINKFIKAAETKESINNAQSEFNNNGSIMNIFQKEIKLKRGRKRIPKPLKYECDICFKTYATNQNLSVHKNIHLDTKPFRCNECGKTFAAHCNLITHNRVHTKEMPFGCFICDKKFMAAGNLQVHMRTHDTVKPYKCLECDKTFLTKFNLETHANTHKLIKPYICATCNKQYSSSYNLRMHVETHLDPDHKFVCSQCNKSFRSKVTIRNHLKNVHGEKNAL